MGLIQKLQEVAEFAESHFSDLREHALDAQAKIGQLTTALNAVEGQMAASAPTDLAAAKELTAAIGQTIGAITQKLTPAPTAAVAPAPMAAPAPAAPVPGPAATTGS